MRATEFTPNSYSVVEQFAFKNNMLEENLEFELFNKKFTLRFYPLGPDTIPYINMEGVGIDGTIKRFDYCDPSEVRNTSMKNIEKLIDNLEDFGVL